jgi:hypothetical protein
MYLHCEAGALAPTSNRGSSRRRRRKSRRRRGRQTEKE